MPEARTVLNPAHRAGLVARIMTISEDTPGQWGKMTATDMFQHLHQFDVWVQGGGSERQEFVGRLFGWFALRTIMRPGGSVPKNIGTLRNLIPKGGVEFEAARQAWLSSLDAYSSFSQPYFLHDFFGKMTPEKTGQFVWKHADYHLGQFGA